MSFEMKYNKDGVAIRDKQLELQPEPVVENVVPVSAASNPPMPETGDDHSISEAAPEQEAISSEPAASEEEYNQAAEQAEVVKQKTSQDNFRALREKSERLERERDEYMRKLQEAQSAKVDDADITIGDEDLAEGKHLKKLQAEVKRLRQESESSRQQSSLATTEVKLKTQYPDFDRVVSADNIASLRDAYPELAASINSNADLYSKAVSAYTMIKKLGIHQDPVYSADKARVAQNASKPKPSATIAPQKSDSPLSQANAFANGLTADLQKQLRAEMESSRKGY